MASFCLTATNMFNFFHFLKLLRELRQNKMNTKIRCIEFRFGDIGSDSEFGNIQARASDTKCVFDDFKRKLWQMFAFVFWLSIYQFYLFYLKGLIVFKIFDIQMSFNLSFYVWPWDILFLFLKDSYSINAECFSFYIYMQAWLNFPHCFVEKSYCS